MTKDLAGRGWLKRMQAQQQIQSEEAWEKRGERIVLQVIVGVCLGIILIALAALWLSWGESNMKKEFARFDKMQAENAQQEAEFQKFLRGK